MFKHTKINTYSLQCSTQTTEADIKELLNHMGKDRTSTDTSENKLEVNAFFLDASLIDSEEAPLDPLFQQLDNRVVSTDSDDHSVACVLLSNNVPDAAITSRMVLVAQSPLDNGSTNLYNNLSQLKRLCSGSPELASLLQMSNRAFSKENPKYTRLFYQLRDFVYTANELCNYGEKKNDFEVLFRVLCRQFGGMQSQRYAELVERLSISDYASEKKALLLKEQAPVWMVREMIKLITNGPHFVPSPGDHQGKRFLLLIDDTECGAGLSFVKALLNKKPLIECSVTDFPDDTQDPLHQNAILTMAKGMQQGKTVLLTHLVPVSPAFFSLLNLETEPKKVHERDAHYANIAIGSILRPYPVNPNFSVIVHMSRSEVETAPTALLNRFQKMLFTFDDLFLYFKGIVEQNVGHKIDSNVFLNVNECRKRCEELVEQCGEFCFFGFSRSSTISSILLSSLTAGGQFQCAPPYDLAPCISEENFGRANARKALEMLMLVARPDMLRFCAFDPSLRHAYKSQIHSNVVDFIKNLKSHKHSSSICWNVFTEKSKGLDSINLFREKLKDAKVKVSVITLLCNSKEEFREQARNAFEEQAKVRDEEGMGFVVCLADMERTTPHNVLFARTVLEEEKKDHGGVYVVLVQLFSKRQEDPCCTAVFTNEWRSTFVSSLCVETESISLSREEAEKLSEIPRNALRDESRMNSVSLMLSRSRIRKLRVLCHRHIAARTDILRFSCASGDQSIEAVKGYAELLDERLVVCQRKVELQQLFLTLVLLNMPSRSTLGSLRREGDVEAWCVGAVGPLLRLSKDVDGVFAALGCPQVCGDLGSELAEELDDEAWDRLMTRTLRRVLTLLDEATVRRWGADGAARTLPCIDFSAQHLLALVHLALHAPAAAGQHADTVRAYCRKAGLRVPAGAHAVTMAALCHLAVKHCGHTILGERLGFGDVRVLGAVRGEMRSIMLRLTVAGGRPDVDALVTAAERSHRLRCAGDAAQRARLHDACCAWVRCYLQYLNRLRKDPENAVVLPPFLAAAIYMHLPSGTCFFHPFRA